MRTAEPESERCWDELRQQRYFGSCSQGALCTRVEAAVGQYLDSWRQDGCPWESEWLPVAEVTALAHAVGAPVAGAGGLGSRRLGHDVRRQVRLDRGGGGVYYDRGCIVTPVVKGEGGRDADHPDA